MSYAVVVTTVTDPVVAVTPVADGHVAVAERTQPVRDTTTGEVAACAVFDRVSLPVGARVVGPAIVAEDETSTLIGPGWTAKVNALGYLELTRETQ